MNLGHQATATIASFHRDPRRRSPYWHVAFLDAGGRRIFRSTKKASRGEAQEIGLKWEREAAGLRAATQAETASSIPLSNPHGILERFIEITHAATRGEFTESTARSFLDDLLTVTGQKPLSDLSTAKYLRDWVGRKKVTRAAGTFTRYERAVENFIASLGNKADRGLAAVTATDIENFRDSEIKAGKRTATVETALKVLNAAFTKARRQGLVTLVPTEAIDALPREGAERRAFSHVEIRQLVAAADWQGQGMILVAYHTGLRIQDCARLKWSDVDFARHVLILRPQKERRDREAKKHETFMPDELRQFLGQLAALIGNQDAEQFWITVKTNLQAGRIRKLFVADEIPEELRRVIEFLNSQMDPAEVLGVEIKQFTGGTLKTLVPRVVGQTAEAEDRKSTGSRTPKRQWDEASYFAALEDRQGAPLADIARRILHWAVPKTTRILWGCGNQNASFIPVLHHAGSDFQLFAVYTGNPGGTPVVEIHFQFWANKPPFSDQTLRLELRSRLNEIPGVTIPADAIQRRPSFPLELLNTDHARKLFFETFEWFLSRVRNLPEQ